jgi:hypothetical protein
MHFFETYKGVKIRKAETVVEGSGKILVKYHADGGLHAHSPEDMKRQIDVLQATKSPSEL